ncbi:TlpA family protein disulfide reductase [Flavobacterium ajazii]|uniref:TlpA family protein disulfide reductase n=1 Tax=Flavobacterium ajazii TaxID=2692318 RepID=UPI0013CFE324|nr:TlpA disulfide reductase family protein [Flavobacterium ajazii]
MKIIFFILLILCTLNVQAQENQNDESKLASLQNEKNPVVLQSKIKNLEQGTSEDLLVLVQYYSKDKSKKAAAIKLVNDKYPNSNEAKMARLFSFSDITGGANDIEVHFKSLQKTYPTLNMDFEKNFVAMAYAELPDASKMMAYINSIEDQVYRVGAIKMNIDLLIPIDFEKSLQILTAELDSAQKIKNLTVVDSSFKIDPQPVYYEYVDLYAKLLLKKGNYKESYKYTKEAYDNLENKDKELKENYALLSSIFDANYQESLPILAKAIQDGNNSKEYLEEVRKAYAKLYPDKDVNAYLSTLQQGFVNKIKSKVEKLLINEKAPDFYVTDVDGKKVILADFKGKTIVLDFWATWCGPCVASFPAMKLAVNRYSNDSEVKFLFIHTWDNVPHPLIDAKQFLSKRNYSFDLYMDLVNPNTKRPPAASSFKIDGIPAKFIIDSNGMIRFKVSGFEGTDEEVAEEVVQMVELARGKDN